MVTVECLFCQHCCSQCETQLSITHNMTYGMHSTTYFDFMLLLRQNQLFLKKASRLQAVVVSEVTSLIYRTVPCVICGSVTYGKHM